MAVVYTDSFWQLDPSSKYEIIFSLKKGFSLHKTMNKFIVSKSYIRISAPRIIIRLNFDIQQISLWSILFN